MTPEESGGQDPLDRISFGDGLRIVESALAGSNDLAREVRMWRENFIRDLMHDHVTRDVPDTTGMKIGDAFDAIEAALTRDADVLPNAVRSYAEDLARQGVPDDKAEAMLAEFEHAYRQSELQDAAARGDI
jgi:hypothetical protein